MPNDDFNGVKRRLRRRRMSIGRWILRSKRRKEPAGVHTISRFNAIAKSAVAPAQKFSTPSLINFSEHALRLYRKYKNTVYLIQDMPCFLNTVLQNTALMTDLVFCCFSMGSRSKDFNPTLPRESFSPDTLSPRPLDFGHFC